MTVWVALLYSVVLGEGRRVTSADLFRLAEAAGTACLCTVLSTGNMTLRAEGDAAGLERRLEAASQSVLGRKIPVFVRSVAEWRALAAANPFPEATARNPATVAVRIMRQQPADGVLARIAATAAPGESFTALDRALWIATADRLSTTPLLRAASATWAGEGTFRNASAVMKIAAALGADG